MPFEPAAVGLWYGGTLLADCSRFNAMELTAKTYLQNEALEIRTECCLDETQRILQRIWSQKRRRMLCEPAAVGLWYGGTLLANCSRFIAMELTAKTYLQNKALEIRIECCLDETEDLVQEEPYELDAV
jgi:hypothetical protein